MRVKTNDKYVLAILKNTYEELSNEVMLSAKLNRVYADKFSKEVVNGKVNHQCNALEASIHQINSKFIEKSKNYEKIKEEMIKLLGDFEEVLKRCANSYDEQIEQLICQKVELEMKLLMAILNKEYLCKKEVQKDEKGKLVKGLNHVVDKIKTKVNKKEPVEDTLQESQQIEKEPKMESLQSEEYKQNRKFILKLEKEIKSIRVKIQNLNEEKKKHLLDAMEIGGKELVVGVKRPRRIKNITKFFSYRFNTYKVIMKNVIDPFSQRIDEFKVNELKKIDGKAKEFELGQAESKFIEAKEKVLKNIDYKIICKELGLDGKS